MTKDYGRYPRDKRLRKIPTENLATRKLCELIFADFAKTCSRKKKMKCSQSAKKSTPLVLFSIFLKPTGELHPQQVIYLVSI